MPKTTKAYVRTVRPATENDLNDIESKIVRVATYDKALIDKIKSMDADSVSKLMSSQKANNTVKVEKTVKDGFVSIFDVIRKSDAEYKDIGNKTVSVVTVRDGEKVLFDGIVQGINGYTVYVKVNDALTVMCPSQSDCWFFC